MHAPHQHRICPPLAFWTSDIDIQHPAHPHPPSASTTPHPTPHDPRPNRRSCIREVWEMASRQRSANEIKSQEPTAYLYCKYSVLALIILFCWFCLSCFQIPQIQEAEVHNVSTPSEVPRVRTHAHLLLASRQR